LTTYILHGSSGLRIVVDEGEQVLYNAGMTTLM
jgi:hypothetical protein